MTQIIERLKPWASTMVLVGLLSTLAESLQERDVTSVCFIAMSLLGAALVLPAKRPLTREEVRIEIMTGIRAMVQPQALQPLPEPFQPQSLDLLSYRTAKRTMAEAPTDPGRNL